MMKIEYKTVLCETGGVYTVTALRVDDCCAKMRAAIENDFVAIYGGELGGSWSEANLALIKMTAYPEDGPFEEYIAASFCPFCGVPIETVEVERVRRVEHKKKRITTETHYTEEPA